MASFLTSLGNRLRAAGDRKAIRKSRGYPPASVTRFRPTPKPAGNPVLGTELVSGRFFLSGREVLIPDNSIWNLKFTSSPRFDLLHGFGWLDDLASEGSIRSRSLALGWTLEWIERFGQGDHVWNWTPAMTGQRIVRWLNHFDFLTATMDTAEIDGFEASLTHQIWFLNRRARSSPDGLPALEALTGLIYGIAAIDLRPTLAVRASGWVTSWISRNIGPDGGLQSRNPQQLSQALVFMSWAADAIRACGREPSQLHIDAMQRAAGAVRNLRLGNGALARFHGGDAGATALIDHTIAELGHDPADDKASSMGFTRMTNGASVLVMDTGFWPESVHRDMVFSSTLAFEFTSGRSPLLINAGPAILDDADSAEFARSPAAHNTLWISDGLYPLDAPPIRPDPPGTVTARTGYNHHGSALLADHDGYAGSFGVVHSRRVELTENGFALRGEDRLHPDTPGSGSERTSEPRPKGEPGSTVLIGFCVHPGVTVRVDSDDSVVHLVLPNDETWEFGISGGALALLPATVMELDRNELVSTTRIVVSSRIQHPESLIRWSFVCVDRGRSLI